jgi:hypothetical protein
MGIGKSGLQQARLKLELLPPLKVIDADTVGYYVRYRFVSEDRNRLSHWSPTYLLTPPYEFRRPTGVPLDGIKYFETNTGGSNKVVTLAWDTVDVYNNDNYIRKAIAYDVWIKWDAGQWAYEGRQTAPSLTIAVPTPNPGTISVEIYARSIDISRDSNHQQLLLYKRDNMAV